MVMYDLIRIDDACTPNKNCGTLFGIPFFITFQVICNYVMLNLFILIVLSSFEEYNLKKVTKSKIIFFRIILFQNLKKT